MQCNLKPVPEIESWKMESLISHLELTVASQCHNVAQGSNSVLASSLLLLSVSSWFIPYCIISIIPCPIQSLIALSHAGDMHCLL